jgi:hypothetical protein
MGGSGAENTYTGSESQTSAQSTEPPAVEESRDEATSSDSTLPAEDARDTRPEPFENAFGSAAHPAEPQPSAAEDATPRSPEPRVAPDTPDADGQ